MMKKVFAVSILAIMAVATADAKIVSQENIVGTNGITVSVPKAGETNAGKVQISGPTLPTVNNATLTIAHNGTSDTFTANASANKTITITDADHITTATTTGTGNVVTGISADANGALTVTKGITALTAHQDISGKENTSNKVTSITSTSTDTQYPSAKAVYTELAKKQGTIAANTYDAYGAATDAKNAIEGKLDDGASGYDINAKSLKVQGASVLTAHQDISGKQNNLGGSGNDGKAVIATGTAGTVNYRAIDTTSGGTASSTSLITSGAVNAGLGTKANSADLTSHTGNTTVHITAAERTAWNAKQAALGYTPENASKKVTDTADLNDTNITGSTDRYPSMKVMSQAITTSGNNSAAAAAAAQATANAAQTTANNAIPKTISADKNSVMVRNSAGTYVKGTGSDISVSDAGAITVNHATKANQIPSGSETSTTFASIWVE